MKNIKKNIIIIMFSLFSFIGPIAVFAAGPVTIDLGSASNFAILSKTAITDIPSSIIIGNVGASPITGAAIGLTCPEVTGTIYSVDATGPLPCRVTNSALLNTAVINMEAAYTNAAGRILPDGVDLYGGNLGGKIFGPGIYKWNTNVTIPTNVTLSGSANDVWIFQISGNLDISSATQVILTGGANSANIFWQVGGPTGATLGTTSVFNGTILSAKQIILQTNAILNGRALSQTQVTLDQNNISIPIAPPALATLHIIKQVVNTGGGTGTVSSFNINVKNAGIDVSGSPTTGTGSPGTSYSLSAGTYVVSENLNTSYTGSFSGACDSSGNVILLSGDNKTCIITNTYIPAAVVVVPPVVVVVPPVSSGGSGGGGGTWNKIDYCPDGDYSYSYYDGICGVAPIVNNTKIVPIIGIIKVPKPLALPVGSGSVTYNYVVWNVGGIQALTDITVTDDKCDSVIFISGDLNNNNKLDPSEKWKYQCTSILLETTTNTAIAAGYSDDIYHQSTVATAITTVVVGEPIIHPLINIVKIPNRLIPFPFGGGDVKYGYIVRNLGIVPISDVKVTDDKCSPISSPTGDINNNNLLDVKEKWIYTCQTNIKISTRNIATVEGKANGFTAIGKAYANVLVSNSESNTPQITPTPLFPNTGFPPEEKNILGSIGIFLSIFVLISMSIFLTLKKYKI